MLPRLRTKRSALMILGLVLMLAAAGSLSACAPLDPSMAVSAQTQSADGDMEADQAAIEALWRNYETARLERDLDLAMSLWEDEGIQMSPNRQSVVGKDAIEARISAGFDVNTYDSYQINLEEVTISGDVAVSRGTYAVAFTNNESGETTTVDGKFMSLLRRQPDGSWQLYRDIYNSNIPPAGPADDLEAVTAAVEANWDEYSAALNSDDAERWAALWLDDGVQMPPGTPMREGKATIAEAVGASMDAFVYDMEITNLEVLLSGDMAVARGLYTATLTPKAGGDDVYIDGKYMSVLMRQPDGSWKLYRDIFNSNVPN